MYFLYYIFIYRYYEHAACIFAMIVCTISVVVPSRNDFYMQVCGSYSGVPIFLVAVACLVRSVSRI